MKYLWAIVTAAFISAASASQVTVEVLPDGVSDIKISKDEFTLFKVKDARILRIDGERFIDDMEREKDFPADLRKAFIKPATLHPFTIYITDSKKRTFALNITPDPDMKGGIVELVDASPVREFIGSDTPILGSSLDRNQRIKNMIEAMRLEKHPSDVTVRKTLKPINWWSESEVYQTHEYEGRSMIGLVLSLKNISERQMVMAEHEFKVKNAIAASILNPVLNPGESTKVFILVQKQEDE